MYITLKGIEKALHVSVLEILLISKFLNFTAIFTKEILTFETRNFPCKKVNFSLIHPSHITIYSF